MEVNSHIIKTCLMKYWRFKRRYICVDEIGREPADILVDTGKTMIEIEIKISKSDLWNGEARKRKHKLDDTKRGCNQFYLCVPTELIDEGKKWIDQTNPKYGLIEFDTKLLEKGYYHWYKYLSFIKKPKKLNNKYNMYYKNQIPLRLCSALANAYEKVITQ